MRDDEYPRLILRNDSVVDDEEMERVKAAFLSAQHRPTMVYTPTIPRWYPQLLLTVYTVALVALLSAFAGAAVAYWVSEP